MERRQNWTCESHEEAFRAINKKLDDIVNRQIAYAETSTRIEMKQEQLEKIVTNGLTHNIADAPMPKWKRMGFESRAAVMELRDTWNR
jgi:hypothetical protein